MILDELKAIRSGRKDLRSFGLLIGVVCGIAGAYFLWRGSGHYPYLFAAAVLFAGTGLALPVLLLPLQKLWMGFAVVIGFFVSRIVLVLLYYCIVTPIGMILRTAGKDLLGRAIDPKTESYWSRRDEAVDPKSAENQY